ncbi:MAG TPA: carboxylesterase [Chromatiales bacterium]|nr:carboxylesterase [Chromatiales bacterium]
MEALLDRIEVQTGRNPDAAVIWLHGLGADGYDFEPIVPQLELTHAVRFVFPHAPVRPVTINGGLPMRAWFDLYGLDPEAREDIPGLETARRQIEALVAHEIERGIPAERIVLAGFSQGGAVAFYAGLRRSQPLAGLVGLSTFLPAYRRLAAEHAPEACDRPIFMAHGSEDETIRFEWAAAARALLESLGCRVEWHTYYMGHEVSPAEIRDLGRWLVRVLFPKEAA